MEILLNLLPDILGSVASTGILAQWLIALSSIVGAASVLVKAFTVLAKITPNTDDDQLASQMEKWITKIVKVFDRIALNPDMNDARMPRRR